MSERYQSIFRKAVVALLVYNFAVSGALKVFGYQAMSELFRRWGYADWMRITVGGVELGAATLLLWKPGRRLGAQIMVAVIGRAIATLLSHNELPQALGPMTVVGLLFLRERLTRRRSGWHIQT
jgi:DoxX-like family